MVNKNRYQKENDENHSLSGICSLYICQKVAGSEKTFVKESVLEYSKSTGLRQRDGKHQKMWGQNG